ncbi:hypothetical protein [Streptomyces sp. NPDC052225]|uniref:hypothetical protein n=1 Tax=Streptomyces sp. NPDC052225 TaxID=3154949 RepID=UPI00342B3CFA
MSASTICRPTERAAMSGLGKYGRPLPPLAHLLTGRLIARLVGDRHGLQLFDHAIARLGGEGGE